MLAELNKSGDIIGTRIYRRKVQFMKDYCFEEEAAQLERSQLTETTSCEFRGRSMNMERDMKDELDRRRRAAWPDFKPLKETTDHLTTTICDQPVWLFAETWTDTASASKALRTTE